MLPKTDFLDGHESMLKSLQRESNFIKDSAATIELTVYTIITCLATISSLNYHKQIKVII